MLWNHTGSRTALRYRNNRLCAEVVSGCNGGVWNSVCYAVIVLRRIIFKFSEIVYICLGGLGYKCHCFNSLDRVLTGSSFTGKHNCRSAVINCICNVCALVGRAFVIIDSSIWVAVITCLPAVYAFLMSFFCIDGISSNGISTPISPRAIIIPSAAAIISSILLTPLIFSIFAIIFTLWNPTEFVKLRR